MIVISDTSVISGLIKIDGLDLLREVFNEVIVPTKVCDELQELSKFGYDLSIFDNADWIRIAQPTNMLLIAQLQQTIHQGEAEAIVLALEMSADYLLIDEREGRKVAKTLGLSVTGLIGVLVRAKNQGYLDNIKPILDDLINVNFRISPSLYAEILAMVGE